MKHITAILGAADVEMDHIQSLLDECAVEYHFAYDGINRVDSKTAYKQVSPKQISIGDNVDYLVMIECSVHVAPVHYVIRVDHHNKGDPGYDKDPKDYWVGSSLGQIHSFLRECGYHVQEPTKEQKMAAAADHCLGAAYAGLCPGIYAEDLKLWRVDTKAKYQRKSPKKIMEELNSTIYDIEHAQRMQTSVFDHIHDPQGNLILKTKKGVTELPEASAIVGQPVIYTFNNGKIGILTATPEQVDWFMNDYAIKENIKNVYGVPKRGYAGGTY